MSTTFTRLVFLSALSLFLTEKYSLAKCMAPSQLLHVSYSLHDGQPSPCLREITLGNNRCKDMHPYAYYRTTRYLEKK